MRTRSYIPQLVLVFILVLVISLPHSWVNKLRSYVSPILHIAERVQEKNAVILAFEQEVARLKLQKLVFEEQLQALQALIQQKEIQEAKIPILQQRGLDKFHQRDLQEVLLHQLQSVPARIISFSTNFWEHIAWINLGSNDISYLQPNSPVVVGDVLIGVVERVEPARSRIRLITDPCLQPAVRVVRGKVNYDQMRWMAQQMVQILKNESFDFLDEEKEAFLILCKKLNLFFSKSKETWYLAKGVLQGTHQAQWRRASSLLHGYGFNYDYGDERGAARDLVSGQPIGDLSVQEKKTPLVLPNDLLITSGLDGIFPPGLQVARVIEVDPLKEGGYFLEIKAQPLLSTTQLDYVFVLPNYSANEEFPSLR